MGDGELLLKYIGQPLLYGHQVVVHNWKHVLFNLVESVLDHCLVVLLECGMLRESINLYDILVNCITNCKYWFKRLLEQWLEVGVI